MDQSGFLAITSNLLKVHMVVYCPYITICFSVFCFVVVVVVFCFGFVFQCSKEIHLQLILVLW